MSRPLMTNANARSVRMNMVQHISSSPLLSKTLSLAYIISKVVIGFTFVFVFRKSSCEEPLDMWILVYLSCYIYRSMIYLLKQIDNETIKSIVSQLSYLTSLVERFEFIWYFIGWYYWSGSSTQKCSQQIVTLTLILLIEIFVRVGIFLILLVGIFCCCLPTILWLCPNLFSSNNGVSQEQIDSLLPVENYRSETVLPHTTSIVSPVNTTCAICTDDFVGGDLVRTLTCHHQYHSMCLDPWLLINATCPLCRQEIHKIDPASLVSEV